MGRKETWNKAGAPTYASPVRRNGFRAGLVIAAAALLCVFLGNYASNSKFRPQTAIYGNLAPGELAAIRRLVRNEIWRDLLPYWSWSNIRNLPREISARNSERIRSIVVNSDETVVVQTIVEVTIQGTLMCSYGRTYKLKKIQKRWRTIDRGDWIS